MKTIDCLHLTKFSGKSEIDLHAGSWFMHNFFRQITKYNDFPGWNSGIHNATSSKNVAKLNINYIPSLKLSPFYLFQDLWQLCENYSLAKKVLPIWKSSWCATGTPSSLLCLVSLVSWLSLSKFVGKRLLWCTVGENVVDKQFNMVLNIPEIPTIQLIFR